MNLQGAGRQASEEARTEALFDIVRAMNRSLPLPELLALICRRTVEAFGLRQATIFYHHARARGYVPVADYGTPASVFERFSRSRFTLTNTPHFEEIVAGRTVIVGSGSATSDADRELLELTELESLALLPLRSNEQIRGTLSVGLATGEFTPDQIAGLEIFAHHAATAIYQARSLRASMKAARFRAEVSALAVELRAEMSRTGAFDILCARTRAMFDATAAVLLLADGEGLLAAAADPGGTSAVGFSTTVTRRDHPAMRAFAGGQVVLADDLRADAPATDGFRSLLAIPLAGDDGVGGVLLVGHASSPQHFDPRMVQEAGVLGALAASVLRNLDLMTRLQEANSELRRLSTLKDRFLANVSHDLRSPLNVIIGYAQLAREGTFGVPGPELGQVLERIVASAEEQLALVSDLLDVSRIELDHLTMTPSVVPLAPLFAELEYVLENLLRGRPLRAVVGDAAGVSVRADRDRVRQVLTNLLGNAAKFTDVGSVELSAAIEDDRVRISVRDTGTGIAPEDQERIFEPFRQVEEGRSHLGAGLGLAIARRLAGLMDGALEVESAIGEGSTFSLILPSAQ